MFKSKLKGCICGIISCILLISGASISNANEYKSPNEPYISEAKFNELKENGVYGDEVTYSDILNSVNTYDEDTENYILKSTSRSAYVPRKGDIVTTGSSNTASGGLIGHAGIFIDSSTILHIAGSNTSKVTTMSWSTWKNTYKTHNMVLRVPNSTVANQAANWVINKYKGKSPGYKITTDWRGTSPTYCSKIVWQGYYFGTGSTPVMKPPVEPLIIQPRTIATYFRPAYSPAGVFYN